MINIRLVIIYGIQDNITERRHNDYWKVTEWSLKGLSILIIWSGGIRSCVVQTCASNQA